MNKLIYAFIAIIAAGLLASAANADNPIGKATRARPNQGTGLAAAPPRITSFKRSSDTTASGMHASGQAKGSRFQVEIHAGGGRLNGKLIVKRVSGGTIATPSVWIEAGGSKTISFSEARSIEDGCNATRYTLELEGTGVKRTGRVTPRCDFDFETTQVPVVLSTDVAGGHGDDYAPRPLGVTPLTALPQCNAAWPITVRVKSGRGEMETAGGLEYSWVSLRLQDESPAHLAIAVSDSKRMAAGTLADLRFNATKPFLGQPGSYVLVVHSNYGSEGFSAGKNATATGPLKVDIRRTCTFDSALEP